MIILNILAKFVIMLNFQDFSKFSKILKSAIQYLCRDISNVKIGLYLRSSHKKDWKTHFWPYSLKKLKKEMEVSPHFSESFRQKKNWKSDLRSCAFAPPPLPKALDILNRWLVYICLIYFPQSFNTLDFKLNICKSSCNFSQSEIMFI